MYSLVRSRYRVERSYFFPLLSKFSCTEEKKIFSVRHTSIFAETKIENLEPRLHDLLNRIQLI